MARQLYPADNQDINGLNPTSVPYVTEDQLNEVINQIHIVAENLALTTNDLETFKASLRQAITTVVGNIDTLNSDQANIVSATITNALCTNLNSMTAIITSLQSTNILTALLSATTVTGENASFSDTVAATNINATNKVTATEVETQNLIVNGAHTFDTININTANTTTENVTNANITNANITNETVDSSTITDLTATDAKITNAEINDIENTHIETDFITHETEYGTIIGNEGDYIIVELPRFVNGYAQLAITDTDGNIYMIAEAHNSANNWMVKYSKCESWVNNPLETIAFYDNNAEISQCYFKVILNDKTYKWYFKLDSLDTKATPQLYRNEWPVPISSTGFKSFDVVSQHQAATLFNRPTIRADQTTDVSPLTITSTDIYNITDSTAKTYDTTSAVLSRSYKPNQSLNKTDNVEFNTVKAPFLDIADTIIQAKLKTPNIYNGPSVNPASLNDDTLYLPLGTAESGSLNRGWAIYNNAATPVQIKNFASTILKSFNNQFYNTEYKPQDGYTINYGADTKTKNVFNIPSETDPTKTTEAIEARRAFIVVNNVNNQPYIININSYAEGAEYSIGRLTDIAYNEDPGNISPNRKISAADIFTDNTREYSPTWNAFDDNHVFYGIMPVEGTQFYIFGTETGATPNGDYTVVYSDVQISTDDNITYTKAGSTSTISRKATKNGLAQVLPIIPYEEVSTVSVPVDETHPIVYDPDTDSLKKSTGFITIEDGLQVNNDTTIDGDLDVTGDISGTDITASNDVIANNDLAAGNDLSVQNDATIGGDLSVTGDITADSLGITHDVTINGDLWVNGITHQTTVEELTADGDIITVRANNNSALTSGQVSGVVIHKYNGTDDLVMVTDSDGTMRVGTGSGTDTTYTKIALKTSDGKYYSYDDTDPTDIQYTLLNPQPSGTMMSWTGKQEISGYTLWATAVFTVIDKTTLEPVLTRDEHSNLQQDQILYYDKANYEAKGLVMPTANNESLIYKNESAGSANYYTDGNTIYDINGHIVTPHSGTAGTPTALAPLFIVDTTIVGTTDNGTTWYNYTDFETQGTLNTGTFDVSNAVTISKYTVTWTAQVGYAWENITQPIIDTINSLSRAYVFETMADYTAVASTIPNGSIIIIKDETTYVIGEQQ